MGQFAETHFAEFGINFFSAKWASKFGKVGIEIQQSGQGSCLHLQKPFFESENIM